MRDAASRQPARPGARHRHVSAWMLAFAAACAPATAAAADAVVPPRAITAAGTAEVRVAPDVAQVLVGVVTAAPRAADAVDANSRIVDKVLVALGEFSIAERDLQTVGFRVEPEFSQPPRNADPNWTPAIVGFRVHNQVQVRTRDLVRAGEMLAAAAAAGANQIGGITFTLSDAKPHERRAQAEATRDALAQVAAIADAAGVRTGRILALNAAGGGIEPVYREYARGAMMMAADAVAPVPVQAGEVVIRASVTASVAIAD